MLCFGHPSLLFAEKGLKIISTNSATIKKLVEGFVVGNFYRAGLVVIISIAIATFCSFIAKAETSSGASFTWLGVPTEVTSRYSSGTTSDDVLCTGFLQVIHLEGRDHTNNGCVYGNSDELRVASYPNSQGYWMLAVSFPLEIDFHELRGLCGGTQRCAYAPETDTFAAPFNGSVGFFSNFSQHLQRRFDRLSMTTYYEYSDTTDPVVIRKGDNTARASAVAFSDNGRWAIVELFSYGFIRVDTSDFSMRRVIAPSGDYGVGRDPTFELAISNSGRQVAVTGYMLGLLVFEINSSCGDYLTNESTTRFGWGSDPCGAASIDTAALIGGFQYGRRPSFDASGQRLRFTAVLADSTRQQVVISPAGVATGGSLEYLALGDSFASGEGELSDDFYLEMTRKAPHACHISTRAYPYLLANYWGLSSSKSVACSGATTKDISGTGEYFGQGSRAKDLPTTEAQRSAIEASTLSTFQPGILHQAEFISRYRPDFVTIGIGGNDAGLLNKLKVCVNTDTCEWVEDDEKRLATAEEIKATYLKLRASLRAIKLASPASRVMVVSYPRVINESNDANCGVLLGALLNAKERRFMDEAIKYLNSIIKSAAKSEGVLFANIEDAFLGHRLCDAQNDAMNGIRGGDDFSPIGSAPLLKVIGAESFHPTPKGHALSALAIQSVYGSVPSGLNCESCLDEQSAPPPPEYWGSGLAVAEQPSQRRQVEASFLESKIYQPGQQLNIATVKNLFNPTSPNNQVEVELRSEKVLLGVSGVDSEGRVVTSVRVPSDISEGYHTVHLYGYSMSGDLVDIYQIIAVERGEDHAPTAAVSLIGLPQGSAQFGDHNTLLVPTVANSRTQMNTQIQPYPGQLANVLGVSDESVADGISIQKWSMDLRMLAVGVVLGIVVSGGVLGSWMLIWLYRRRHKAVQQV